MRRPYPRLRASGSTREPSDPEARHASSRSVLSARPTGRRGARIMGARRTAELDPARADHAATATAPAAAQAVADRGGVPRGRPGRRFGRRGRGAGAGADQKIRVHGFYCVVALMVARLMRREAQRAGVSMSVGELLQTLGGIQETVLLYQGERGRPRARRMLTEIDPTQRRLYDLFGLDAYAPKR